MKIKAKLQLFSGTFMWNLTFYMSTRSEIDLNNLLYLYIPHRHQILYLTMFLLRVLFLSQTASYLNFEYYTILF